MSLPGRILFICHDGQIYGSQQSLVLMLKRLPASTYRCYVSLARSGALTNILENLPNVVVLSHRRLQWVKHDVRSLAQKVGDILVLGCLLLPRTLHLINAIKREKINVVHTNSVVSLEGAMAAKLAGVPHVWHIRELFMSDNPKLYMSLGKPLSRWIIHHFSDRVLCISEAVKNQFGPYVRKNPEKYAVLYNALESAENTVSDEAGQPHQPFTVGYIGRLSEGKRFQDLLEAATILRSKGLDFQIRAAGSFVDAAYEAKIRELLQRHNLTGIVHLLGYQSDLSDLYRSMDLLVVPSWNEPFGRVVIEAMTHGIPCVGTDSGGIPEIITNDETGWLYPAKDPQALAALLEALMRAPERLEPVREKAGRMVRDRFTIEGQIGKLDAWYQEILRQNR